MASGDYNSIIGGYDCTIQSGVNRSIVAGGYSNDILGAGTYSSIFGGHDCRVDATNEHNTIVGGYNNIIKSSV